MGITFSDSFPMHMLAGWGTPRIGRIMALNRMVDVDEKCT
jgi:hypothetical protein